MSKQDPAAECRSASSGGSACISQVILAFHKPFGVLSQFTAEIPGQRTLAEFGFPQGVYPIGRLDADSEGLLLLSDEAGLNEQLLHPRHAHQRVYWALVERVPDQAALRRISNGVLISGYRTQPCQVRILDPQPVLSPRVPPVRFRKHVPDVWLELELGEGKNRQVRRMTAAIGHPTLRLLRVRIGGLLLGALPPGKWRELEQEERRTLIGSRPAQD